VVFFQKKHQGSKRTSTSTIAQSKGKITMKSEIAAKRETTQSIKATTVTWHIASGSGDTNESVYSPEPEINLFNVTDHSELFTSVNQ
jgi:hypothetical protein